MSGGNSVCVCVYRQRVRERENVYQVNNLLQCWPVSIEYISLTHFSIFCFILKLLSSKKNEMN